MMNAHIIFWDAREALVSLPILVSFNLASMVPHRSTKGASKARRDHINHEIRNMRALLPIPLVDQKRLSYLHSMAAVCTYIRKSVLLQGLPSGDALPCPFAYEAFLQALHGFILVTTVQGRLVYVSENVSEYLGLSMVDVLQGDTIYDMVEREDIDIIEPILKGHDEKTSSSERSFVCNMQTSKTFKQQQSSCSMLVRGSFQSFPEPCPFSSISTAGKTLFLALCTPTVDRLGGVESHLCPSFHSVHALDMSFTRLSDSVLYFMGYSAEEMVGRSWYSLVHPEDLSLSVNHHRRLIQADEGLKVHMVMRLQCKDLSWAWSYICATKESPCQTAHICCTNFIISETEAKFLQKRMSDDALRRPSSPTDSYPPRSCKKQGSPNSQGQEACSKFRVESDEDIRHGDISPLPLGGSPSFFTPPYSPASSSSPVQQEELNLIFHMDVHTYADQLPSCPEASPSSYSYPEAALACHLSPHRSLPSQHTFDQGVFLTFNPLSPASPSSTGYDFPACASDARLIPDGLATSDMSESSGDCALHQDDFSLLEQPQEGSLQQVHLVPQYMLPAGLPTPNQSPLSMTSEQYSQMEQAEISILAQQISSLASTFDMVGPLDLIQSTDCLPSSSSSSSSSSCSHQWPIQAALPSTLHTKLLNDGVLESLLDDLDMVAKIGSAIPDFNCHQETACASQLFDPRGPSPTTSENSLAPNVALDPFTLQLGCHDTELHQLNRSLQSNLQQDRLAEENLY